MTKATNLIQVRELDPLLVKAKRIIRHYEKAAGCSVAVLGPDFMPQPNSVQSEKDSPAPQINAQDSFSRHFCVFCEHCRRNLTNKTESGACRMLHLQAVNEARRLGGSYVYICSAGFVFWTSPFYSGERFAGALLSGGIIGVEKQHIVKKHTQNCESARRRREIENFLSGVQEKNGDEVKALAQMMLICADLISGGPEHLQWTVRTASGGETSTKTSQQAEKPAKIAENSTNNHNIHQTDKERMLLACLRRGDSGEARKILGDLLNILFCNTKDNFRGFQLKAMELAVMLFRAVNNPEEIDDCGAAEANNRYLKKIENSADLYEITEILATIVERMSGKIFSFNGVRHSCALRKAERFIWKNYTRKISLKEIADASGLSAPYFSTIFKEEMGENLSNYLNRLRVEKAMTMLAEINMPISEIAGACGFEDQSWFSKIFKSYTGYSPGKYKERGQFVPAGNIKYSISA
jgi:AraC-like DNA-binding protein/ligand-binding sensor protein